MARQERAIRTRNEILKAAATVFNEFGYDAATIAETLIRAQVTRGALYFHFRSKEDLARGVLDQAVTLEGVEPHPFVLQEWVDASMLLAYRLPREPVLSAALRLSVDPKARQLFGTRWPDWIELNVQLLVAAKDHGELLPHVDPIEVGRIVVGAWTGVELINEGVGTGRDLVTDIAALMDLLLPNIAVPGILAKLDTSPERTAKLVTTLPEEPPGGPGLSDSPLVESHR
jgi:AcrR family transcriptional regulator